MEYVENFLLSLVPACIKNIEVHMDYKGQELAEQLFKWILIGMGVVGFVAGYIMQQLSITVYCMLFGLAISSVLTLPPWPMYRRNPLKWQPATQLDGESNTSSPAPPAQQAAQAQPASPSAAKTTKRK